MLVTVVAAAEVPFTTVAKGQTSGQESARQVIARSAGEWQAVWTNHSPSTALPTVDFTSKMVVGIFLGSKPTAGFGVEIVGVKTEGDALVVEYVVSQPKAGTMTAEVLTQPFHLVAVPKHGGPVRFIQVETRK